MRRPVKTAAEGVDAAADTIKRLAVKIEKYGVRITVVKLFPSPVVDVTIKDRK